MPMRPHSGGKKSLDIKRDTRYIFNIEGIASDGTPFKATRAIDKR